MFSSAARTPAHERPTSNAPRRPLVASTSTSAGTSEVGRAWPAGVDAAGRTDTVVRTLAAPESIAEARALTRQALNQWGLGDRADDAAIAVSELAANAFRHGAPPVLLVLRRESRHWPPAATATVRDHGVWDDAPVGRVDGPSVASCDGWLAESGRGLAIVRALADSLVVNARGPRLGNTASAWFVAALPTA